MWSHIVENIVGLLPITAIHLLLPPLSDFTLTDYPPEAVSFIFYAIRSLTPPFLKTPLFLQSCMLDAQRVMEPHHAHLSHIFVHYSYKHLLSNLYNFWYFGYPICAESGSLYMHALFLSGGVVSSLPFDIYISQWYKTNPSTLSSSAMRYWNRFVKDVGLSRTVLLCGSSGACSALLGNMFVHLSAKLMGIVHKLTRRIWEVDNVAQFRQLSVPQSKDYIELVTTSVQMAYFASALYREVACLRLPKETFDLSFLEFSSSVLVNHTAHVQGFVYGCVFALGGMLWKRCHWWRYHPRRFEI